ncbi:MAG: hypothetical protein AMJ53_03270 [Gammaproteobacteria bacterium SG8_11]|nr:MAG: hypothetical protein AMJ53_03270 [Gammaproteobacteria bacterium SG8_11]
MYRMLNILVIFLLLVSHSALAGISSGFYSSHYAAGEGSVIAAVEIKDRGIYNLIVSIQFLRKPKDSKIYKSDEYEQLIDRLVVESRGIALQKILESKELSLTDFAGLKNNIETDIKKLVAEMKDKYLPGGEVEVVFSVSNFFLLEPRDK